MELAVFVTGDSWNPPSTEEVLEHSYNAEARRVRRYKNIFQ
jgi:hypothetical protein